MNPYYEDDAVTIYHGDCRDILPTLGEVDLVLTDPPYGIQGGRGVGNRARGKADYATQGWEDSPAYIKDICVPVIAGLIAKAARVILTPGIRHLHLYPVPDDIGCFWTPAAVGTGSWGLTTFHPIVFYGHDQRAGIGAWPSGRQVTERPGIKGHPCPKPLKAWTWLLAKGSTLETDTILDPFMGSGTTLRAAKDLGRKAVGIEIEERYCEVAATRMSQTVMAV